MTKLALLLAFAVPFAAAQDQKATTEPKTEPARSAKVFAIRNGDPDQIAQALGIAGARVSVDRRLKMVVVSAESTLMPGLADIVQKLDIAAPAPKSIEITAYLIQASMNAADTGQMPTELDAVMKQARALFGYQGFKLADSPILRSRETQQARVSGVLSIPTKGPGAPQYSLFYRPSVIGDKIIRLQDFRMDGHLNVLQTDVEFVEGQRVVVGKSGLEGGDRALMIVLTGRIVQ